jgi:hypothetical protein
MRSCSDVVRCTVLDGAVWMHLDNLRVRIPAHLSEKSQILKNILFSVDDRSTAEDFSLGVPKEWAKAWVARYGREDNHLSNADIGDILNCLLVCLLRWIVRLALLIVSSYLDCLDSPKAPRWYKYAALISLKYWFFVPALLVIRLLCL